MGKEIGPREKALREMREAQYERSREKPPAVLMDRLRKSVAEVPARKPKRKKRR